MYLRHYREQLRQIREASLRAEEEQRKAGQSALPIYKPLDQQIEELMRSLPPAQRDRPWSMDELVIRLKGRYRRHPHAKDVGAALRRLGWQQRRDWSVEGAGRRIWAYFVGPL
jgi:hypothetical protein